MKKIAFLTLLISIFIGCKKPDIAPETQLATVPERLELTPASSVIMVAATKTLTAKFFNNVGVEAPLPSSAVWSSLNNAIATVNPQGVITGVGAGQTSIKLTYNNISATALITVSPTTVPEQLIINAPTNTVTTGGTITFTLSYTNNQGQAAPVPAGVIWSSNNNAIASVNQQGVISGVATGGTIITATLNATTSASANVTVTAPSQERIEINPGTVTLMQGNSANFTVAYFNAAGIIAPVPAGLVWSSNNNAIVTINQQGMINAVSAGQTTIRAQLNTFSSTATVTVTPNTTLATISLSPANILEVNLNQSSTVVATGLNASGNPISGLNFTWASDNNSLVSVNSSGTVTGMGYGTANVTASSAAITSAPLMVQVIRSGNFNGVFNSMGTAKLKIENGTLKLSTTPNFSVSTGAPDLRIYLTNSTTSITGAVEVATLTQRSGAQTWNVPAMNAGVPVTITSFQYVMVWCRQFGGNYGLVTLP
jgi:trimeric autotransporter adhesin